MVCTSHIQLYTYNVYCTSYFVYVHVPERMSLHQPRDWVIVHWALGMAPESLHPAMDWTLVRKRSLRTHCDPSYGADPGRAWPADVVAVFASAVSCDSQREATERKPAEKKNARQ